MRSINAAGGNRCVDVFARPDGSFGFEEFRRDHEDTRGWFAVGGFGARAFGSEAAVLLKARSTVPWLDEAMTSG